MLCGRDVPRYNEPALANVLADVKFIEDEIRRLEKPALDRVLEEVRQAGPTSLEHDTSTDVADNRHHPLGCHTRLPRDFNPTVVLRGSQAK